MESKAEDFALVRRALSPERFEAHRRSHSDSEELILARYRWNAALSESLYVPLQVLEVVLRNSFDSAIRAKTKNDSWLLSIPGWLQPYGQDSVKEAHGTLMGRPSRPMTQARVVQEMNFGFWTSLLNSRYETLFHAIGAQVFPGMPRARRTRAEASVRFENLRALRNRIFHFRRIWNRPNLQQDYDEILEAIAWVNPDARRLLLDEPVEAKFLGVLAREPR